MQPSLSVPVAKGAIQEGREHLIGEFRMSFCMGGQFVAKAVDVSVEKWITVKTLRGGH